MENSFFQAFAQKHLIPIDLLAVMGTLFFFRLSKEQRASSYIWLPFLILIFTFLYENMGVYTHYNYEFKRSVNALLGNTEYPKYNLWLYNFAYRQILTILYLFLIKSWLEPSKKKYINWMLVSFVVSIAVIQFSGLEPIYWFQPILFTIGANMILAGSCLYFFSLISNDAYLNSDPLKLTSFWQMTFILFTYSLTYINYIAMPLLVTFNHELGRSLDQIHLIMGILNLAILVLTIASPKLPKLFEPEPSYGFS